MPPSARWIGCKAGQKLPTIGKDVDDAMDAIEKDNPSLKGVLPKVFAQEKLDKASLGGLLTLLAVRIRDKEAQSKDFWVEYLNIFLGEFALAEGKRAGSSIPRKCCQAVGRNAGAI